MKDKIMFMIIGILLGAIITTAGFLLYSKINFKNFAQIDMTQMNNNRTQPPSSNMGKPPEKLDETNINTNI